MSGPGINDDPAAGARAVYEAEQAKKRRRPDLVRWEVAVDPPAQSLVQCEYWFQVLDAIELVLKRGHAVVIRPRGHKDFGGASL